MQQFATCAEIYLRGEKCRAAHLVGGVGCREDRKRCRQGCACNAIANRMDIWHIKGAAHGINRVDLRRDIIVPDDVLHRSVCRFPRYDKNRDALVHAIFDEAFFRRQIENIKAVDPRRKNDERRFQHIFGCRVILDELVQRRLVHNLARRCRDVFAKGKRA